MVDLYFSAMEVSECCAICTHPVDSSVSTLGEKGSLAINKASKLRKDSIHTVRGKKVHQDCRRNYCKPDQIAKDTNEQSKPSTSSDRLVFRSSLYLVCTIKICSSSACCLLFSIPLSLPSFCLVVIMLNCFGLDTLFSH